MNRPQASTQKNMALFRKKNVANASVKAALPPQLANLLRESWWLLLVAAVLYLVLALVTWAPEDPGWSHSATHADVHNRGGVVGAWLSDIFSVGVRLLGLVVGDVSVCRNLVGYRRIDRINESSRPVVLLACIGFMLMIVASCSMEALRLHSLHMPLPLSPGGVLGLALGGWLYHALGFTGATLALAMAWAIGISLFTGLSWLDLMEKLGGALEWVALKLVAAWHAAQDRRIGRVAAVQREERVSVEKKKTSR